MCLCSALQAYTIVQWPECLEQASCSAYLYLGSVTFHLRLLNLTIMLFEHTDLKYRAKDPQLEYGDFLEARLVSRMLCQLQGGFDFVNSPRSCEREIPAAVYFQSLMGPSAI